jgi:hypothetical protein
MRAPDGDPTRRRVLRAVAGVGTLALAGCVGGDGDTPEEPTESTDADDVDPDLRLNGRVLTSSFPLRLRAPGEETAVTEVHWHGEGWSHWHFQPLEIPLDGERALQAVALDQDLEPIPIGEDEAYQVAVRRTEDTPADLLEVGVADDRIEFRGTTAGEGQLLFELRHDGERAWLSPPLETAVE